MVVVVVVVLVVVDLRSESRQDLGDNETGESRRHCLSGSNQWGAGWVTVLFGCRLGGSKGAVASGAGCCIGELGLSGGGGRKGEFVVDV